MKKIGKKIGKGMHVALEMLLLYLILGIFTSYLPVNRSAADVADYEIYILSNGMHTDIVVPIQTAEMNWLNHLPFENTRNADTNARYLALGWGDKGFYMNTPTWAELKFSTAFKAAFWLSESAIHATYYTKLTPSNQCVKMPISKENYHLLTQFILNSFDWENGKLQHIPTDAVYGDNDAFYESKGTYSLFYTCNTWANNALKAANQKASWWALLDKGIFSQYIVVNPI